MIYIGLPQWSHPKWVRLGITSLEEYARHFNCVEGNTTLYALPKPEIVTRWYEQTHDDFRFCFKFPATISHQAALRHCDDLSSEFFARLAPLASRIGQYWLQLPATFGPRDLPALWHFLDGLPKDFTYGVEVRHPEFFAKGEAEQQLNRGLHERNVNRVILDSRPWYALSAVTTWPTTGNCFASGCRPCRSGISLAPRGCSCIPQTLLTRRRWSIRCGAICAPPCRRQEMRRRFRSNPPFSDILLS